MKIFLLAILFLSINSSFALERKNSGAEYIITAQNLNIIAVQSHFKLHRPDQFKSLGNGQYMIKFKKDPGLSVLKKEIGKGLQIQPNLVYKTLK